MRSVENLYKLIYELIALIVLMVLLYFFIESFIGLSTNKDNQYKQYTKAIANAIKDGGQVHIYNYDPQYIPMLAIDSQENLWVYMYKCPLSENQPINTISAWAISSISFKIPMPPPNGPNTIDAYIFSQDLSSCSLLTKVEVGPIPQYSLKINIQNEGGEVGYLLVMPNGLGLTPPQNSVPYYGYQTAIAIGDDVYQKLGVQSGKIYLYELSTIIIDRSGAIIDAHSSECILSKADKDIVSCIEFPSFFMPPSNKANQYQQPITMFYYATMGQYALKDTVTGTPYIYYQLTTPYVIIHDIDLVFSNQSGQITLGYIFR